jgi:NADPH:quinone reductase-like Zn-dependent oxidoreductase/NADP-dependent 3-hydroxy acid dehydrogenase YdfG
VFAAYVLQTTDDVIHSINSLRRLLVPGGLLVLLELTIVHSYIDLLFGIFPYWWRDRHNRAPLTLDRWTQIIQSAHGFDLPVVSSKESQFGDTLIIARKSTSRLTLIELPEWQDQAWLILANRTQNTENLLDTLLSHLPSSNIMLLQDVINTDDIYLKIKAMLSQYKQLYIVFAWPLELIPLGQYKDETAFKKQEELCNIFICILQTIQQYPEMDGFSFPYVFVLTQNSQLPDSNQNFNLSAAPIIGLARSLSIEYASHHIKLIDLQPTASMFSDSSLSLILIQHLINSRTVDDLDEIVLRPTVNRSMQRFQWHYDFLLSKGHDEASTIEEHTIIPQKDADTNPFQLQVAPSRFIADLTWTRESLPTNSLLPGQVLARVHCVGLNFRDVLKARGLYPHTREFAQSERDQPCYNRDGSLGQELIGSIIRSNSNRLKIGDRIIATGLNSFGTFRSHIIINDLEVLRVYEECPMSDEELATLSTAFLTALLSLKHRVQLKRDQIVLIHAATGATGQACIQYCQAIGARVIATAGTEEKRRFLREHYGIEHVFNSRNLSFAKEVRSLFPNGVNAIINSLSGSFLQESIKLLAPQGHFVELGKRDIYNKSNLSMFDLRENCDFHVIDLVLQTRDEPNSVHEMLNDVMEYCRAGIFKPIEPLTIFEPSEVIDAFTQCSLGQSMGKIVVRIATSEKSLLVKKNNLEIQSNENEHEGMLCRLSNSYLYKICFIETMFPSTVRDNGTILISGGLGGLGLTMARWMIEKRGVKRIVLMSRRTLTQFEKTENNPQFDEWIRLKEVGTKYGASIDVVQVDVTQFSDIYELMQRLNQTSHPIRGIIHSAVVSDDKLLANLNQETFLRVIGPKVHGGWNLHQASQLVQAPLHFFVMFSSIRNHLIDPGSSGYNAGNEFLEALAQYRCEQLRLPALAVSLPGISGAGMFHRQKGLLTNLYSTQGLEVLPTEVSFEIIERLFTTQTYCSSPIIFATNWQTLNIHKDHLANYQLAEIIEKQANRTGVSQITQNSSVHPSETTFEIILERIQVTIMQFLGMANIDRIDINRPLISQGMDSLTAISFCNWLVQEWNVFVTLAEIFQGISIQQVADQVYRKLKEHSKVAVTKETIASIDMEMTEMTEGILEVSTTNKVLLYNGMERILTMLPTKDSKSNVFYISHGTMVATEFLTKLTNNKSNVYVIHAPTNQFDMKRCIHETIAQIRRLQPRGPYSLLPIDNDSKHFVNTIVKQLEQYYIQADINHDY